MNESLGFHPSPCTGSSAQPQLGSQNLTQNKEVAVPPVVPREPYSWLWVCLCSMRRYATSLWFNSLSYRLLLFKKKKKKNHIKKMMLGKVTLSWMCTARSCSSLPSCTCLHLWKIFFLSFPWQTQGRICTFDRATTLRSASCTNIPGSGSVAEVPGEVQSCFPAPAMP